MIAIGIERMFEPLLDQWRALWRRDPRATPFNSPAWLRPWWEVFGNGRPSLVAARHEGRLVGLLPLYRCDQDGGAKLLPIGAGSSDYLDALIEPGAEDLALLLLERAAVIAHGLPCHLPELPADSPLCTAEAAGWARAQDGESAPVLDLREGRSSIPAQRRRTLRQGWRRARERGAVTMRQAGVEDAAEIAEILIGLHGQRWEARGEPCGLFSDSAAATFFRSVVPALAAEGLLRLYLMTIGGRPAAAYCGMQAGKRAFAYLGGFDPEFRSEGVASLVLDHAIDRALAEGAVEFHFLRGREPYKFAWGARDRFNAFRMLDPARAIAA